MPRFTEPRVAYSLAEYVIFPALKFDPHKKKRLAFDTVNYPSGREGALLASRLTEILLCPLVVVDLCHYSMFGYADGHFSAAISGAVDIASDASDTSSSSSTRSA